MAEEPVTEEPGSFLVVVPDGKGAFNLMASHLVETPVDDHTVDRRYVNTAITLGVEGLLSLKVQVESAILLAMGEDWARSLQTMVQSTSHDPTMTETWDLLTALELARARYALMPEEMPVEAVIATIVVPIAATEVQG